jgi:prephenate dehydrogenase
VTGAAGLRIERVVVVGVGLIGGSFALALKAAGCVGEVVGLGRSRGPLEEALKLGVIDRIGDGPQVVGAADLVLVAAPVGQMERIFADLRPHLGPRTTLTDGGSTKQDVVRAARAGLGDRIHQFVPGHPIAGAEKSGPAAARAELYRNRKVVLAPLPESEPARVALVERAWLATGARVFRMTPEEHDAVFAAVSHLPHLLAYALVDQIGTHERAPLLWQHAAGGFRDFTRIASSHPEMWRDICVANREALGAELRRYQAVLARFATLLEAGDGPALEQAFTDARDRRDAWLAQFEGRPGA